MKSSARICKVCGVFHAALLPSCWLSRCLELLLRFSPPLVSARCTLCFAQCQVQALCALYHSLGGERSHKCPKHKKTLEVKFTKQRSHIDRIPSIHSFLHQRSVKGTLQANTNQRKKAYFTYKESLRQPLSREEKERRFRAGTKFVFKETSSSLAGVRPDLMRACCVFCGLLPHATECTRKQRLRTDTSASVRPICRDSGSDLEHLPTVHPDTGYARDTRKHQVPIA